MPWSEIAQILTLSRFCHPSSELHIAEHLYPSTGLSDLLGIGDSKINKDRLYTALDKILPHREELEVFLKNRMGELFDIDYDLLLYDVTSTYFEGEVEGNIKAERGHSRDQRGDCKQLCIGLVVMGEAINLAVPIGSDFTFRKLYNGTQTTKLLSWEHAIKESGNNHADMRKAVFLTSPFGSNCGHAARYRDICQERVCSGCIEDCSGYC